MVADGISRQEFPDRATVDDDDCMRGEYTHSPGRGQPITLMVCQVDSSAQTPWGWAWERNGKGTEVNEDECSADSNVNMPRCH